MSTLGKLCILPVMIVLALSTGCRTYKLSESYQPKEALVKSPKVDTLVVEYPQENRPLKGDSKVAGALLMLIPLVPYGHAITSPETIMRQNFNFGYSFDKDLQDVLLKDLKASGLAGNVLEGARDFKEARVDYNAATGFTPSLNWERSTNSIPKGAKALAIRLNKGEIDSYTTAYCLSIAGAPLWLLGVPFSYCDFNLSLTAQLKDDSGKVLTERFFSSRRGYCKGLYYGHRADLNSMPLLYGKISDELRAFLNDNL